MQGTIINALAIALGGVIGLILSGRLSERFSVNIMTGVGLVVLLVGLQMSLVSKNSIIVLLSLVAGGLIGEAFQIEERFESFSKKIETRIGGQEGGFSKGFVTASLLYCVGPMAITGALQNGLTGKYEVLLVKSFLDGISSVALAAGLGFGVSFAGVSVLIYQGGLSALAQWVKPFLTPDVVTEMTATGGLLILAIALSMLGIKRVKVANYLPALFVAVAVVYAWRLLPK